MVTTTEKIITQFPVQINSLRDCSAKDDPASAKAILASNNMLLGSYELLEECLSDNGALTELGWQELFSAMSNTKLVDMELAVGLYTCSPYCFLIGVFCGSFFVIDTHSVSEALGGNGNGALVYTKDRATRSCRIVTQWIIKRLAASGICKEVAQSVSWIMEISPNKCVWISVIVCSMFFIKINKNNYCTPS